MPLNGLFKLVNKFWLVTDLGLADYLETDATCVNCEGIDALCLGTRLSFFANGGEQQMCLPPSSVGGGKQINFGAKN